MIADLTGYGVRTPSANPGRAVRTGGGGVTLKTNLSAYWQFETAPGNITPDATGHGNNLTFAGTGPLSLPPGSGRINNGWIPSSGNDVFMRTDSTHLIPGGSFSMQAWVNPNLLYAAFNKMLMGRADSSNTFYNFYLGYGPTATFYPTMVAKDLGGTIRSATATTSLVAGFWTHVVGGYDPSIGLWIQANAGTRFTLAVSGVQFTNNIFAIGNYTDQGTATNATIDECAFWDRLLTTAEVTQLYNGGAGLPYASFP